MTLKAMVNIMRSEAKEAMMRPTPSMAPPTVAIVRGPILSWILPAKMTPMAKKAKISCEGRARSVGLQVGNFALRAGLKTL